MSHLMPGALGVTQLVPSERSVRRLFWRDDMESSVCKWSASPTPVGTTVSDINSVASFEGDYVLEVRNATDHPSAQVLFGGFPLGKHSIEFRWLNITNINAIIMEFEYVLPSPLPATYVNGGCSLSKARDVWMYRNAAGTYTDLANGGESIEDDPSTWNYVKLLFDLENNRYSRLITNFLALDISDVALPTFTREAWREGQFRITLRGIVNAFPGILYFDDVRIYLNEE